MVRGVCFNPKASETPCPRGQRGKGRRNPEVRSDPSMILARHLAAAVGTASREAPPGSFSSRAAISLCGQSHFPTGTATRARGCRKWRPAQAHERQVQAHAHRTSRARAHRHARAGAGTHVHTQWARAQAHTGIVMLDWMHTRAGAHLRSLPRLGASLCHHPFPHSIQTLLSLCRDLERSRTEFVNLAIIDILFWITVMGAALGILLGHWAAYLISTHYLPVAPSSQVTPR